MWLDQAGYCFTSFYCATDKKHAKLTQSQNSVQYLETTELPYNERGTAKAIVSEKKGNET